MLQVPAKEGENVTDISFLIKNQSNQGSVSDIPFIDPAIVNTTDFPEQEEIEGVSLVFKKYIYVCFCFCCNLESFGASLHSRPNVRFFHLQTILFLQNRSSRCCKRDSPGPGREEADAQSIQRHGQRRNARMGPSGHFAGPVDGHFGSSAGAHPS